MHVPTIGKLQHTLQHRRYCNTHCNTYFNTHGNTQCNTHSRRQARSKIAKFHRTLHLYRSLSANKPCNFTLICRKDLQDTQVIKLGDTPFNPKKAGRAL